MISARSASATHRLWSASGIAARFAGVSRIEGATALTQISSSTVSWAERLGQRRNGGFGRGVGDHAGAETRLQRRARRDVDDPAAARPARARRLALAKRGDGRRRTQKARQRVHAELRDEIGCRGLGDRGHRKAAGEVDRGPERRQRLVKAVDCRLVGDVDAARRCALRHRSQRGSRRVRRRRDWARGKPHRRHAVRR